MTIVSATLFAMAVFHLSPVGRILDRFPPREEAEHALAFNRQYQRHLQARLDLDPQRRDDLNEALSEAKRLACAWEHLAEGHRYAFSSWGAWSIEHLDQLRDLIGPANYAIGRMPPAAPFWRFEPID